GIFGVGGERQGTILVVTAGADAPLAEGLIQAEHRGRILVGGSNVSLAAMRKAAEVGAAGIVVGGVVDRELIDYLRGALGDPTYDIGVAITGHEAIPFTLVVTEGFGTIRMAERTFEMLRMLGGRVGSTH